MLLYTIVPQEVIFEGMVKDDDTTYKQINYMGCEMIVKDSGDKYIVERLLSTDPQDYLNEKFQPGAIIEAK